MKKCKVSEDLGWATIPKMEWDWLLKHKYLNRKQMKFLKEAEGLGFTVEVRTKGISQYNFKPHYSWAESEVSITKTLYNELKK